jgi:TolB-like protein
LAIPDKSEGWSGDHDLKLESWKEIAAFFKRDLRTVIRWEKELGLPVHRHPGKSKGRVYAHTNELRAWADKPRRVAMGQEATASVDQVPSQALPGQVANPTLTSALSTPEDSQVATASPQPAAPFSQPRRLFAMLAIGLLTIITLAGLSLRHYRHSSISSVAVLPFDSLGAQSDPAFSEGLADEVAAAISTLGGIRVPGRRSANMFQGPHGDLQNIGSRLNVEAVIEGSVQCSGDRMHVAVQLNRTSDGFTIWSRTFDGNSRDTIQMESEIASAVAQTLSPVGKATFVSPPADPEAHALYLQGRYLWNQRNLAAEQKSVEFMRRAIAKDPNYALARSGLADSLMTIGNLDAGHPSAYIPEAQDAAKKALELDPNLANAHAVLGRIAAHYNYDWPTAETEYKKAIALNPNYATAHQYYALGLMAHGRFAEAQQQLDVARQLDPLALVVGVDAALLRKFQRDFAGVISESQRVLQLDPNYHVANSMLATGYYLSHRWDDWRAVDAKDSQTYPVARALVNGQPEEAKRALLADVQRAEKGEITPDVVVREAVRAGDHRLAMDWLQRSYQNHDYWLLFMNVDPEMDPIRYEPQFQSMMHHLGV